MTWLSRSGLGLAVVAALALGRVVAEVGEDDHLADATFERNGRVGDSVSMRYADLEVEKVEVGPKVDAGSQTIASPGRLIVMTVRVTANHAPLARPYFQIHDRHGRVFRPDERAGAYWTMAAVGVPMTYPVIVDVPRDALEGAFLTMSENEFDQRRDDEARIDLGIDSAKAKRLWDATATVKVRPGMMDLS